MESSHCVLPPPALPGGVRRKPDKVGALRNKTRSITGGLLVLRARFVSALCWVWGYSRAWGRRFVSSEKKSTMSICTDKYDHITWRHVPGRKQINELDPCDYTSALRSPASSKHQGAHQKCRVSGPAQDLLNLHFNEILSGCLWSRGQGFFPSLVITPGEKKYSLTYWDLNILFLEALSCR